MKWSGAFRDFLSQVVGVHMIPLSYVIQEVADHPAVALALAQDQPYSETHGLVEAELVAQATHTHALY